MLISSPQPPYVNGLEQLLQIITMQGTGWLSDVVHSVLNKLNKYHVYPLAVVGGNYPSTSLSTYMIFP